MLAALVSNSQPQVIHPPLPPEVLRFQTHWSPGVRKELEVGGRGGCNGGVTVSPFKITFPTYAMILTLDNVFMCECFGVSSLNYLTLIILPNLLNSLSPWSYITDHNLF